MTSAVGDVLEAGLALWMAGLAVLLAWFPVVVRYDTIPVEAFLLLVPAVLGAVGLGTFFATIKTSKTLRAGLAARGDA